MDTFCILRDSSFIPSNDWDWNGSHAQIWSPSGSNDGASGPVSTGLHATGLRSGRSWMLNHVTTNNLRTSCVGMRKGSRVLIRFFLEEVGLRGVSSIMAIHGPTSLSRFLDRACRAATCKECMETQVLLEAGELQIDKPRLLNWGVSPEKWCQSIA